MQLDVCQSKIDGGECGEDIQRVKVGRDSTSRADSMIIRNVEEELCCLELLEIMSMTLKLFIEGSHSPGSIL